MTVELGDVEAPNLRTVEAKQKAKWPLQGQATEQRHGPGQLPREAPNDLKNTGTCKPVGEPTILRSDRGIVGQAVSREFLLYKGHMHGMGEVTGRRSMHAQLCTVHGHAGGACSRSLGTTSQKNARANEVVALSPLTDTPIHVCNVAGTTNQWKEKSEGMDEKPV
jgi:hypothetical protein